MGKSALKSVVLIAFTCVFTHTLFIRSLFASSKSNPWQSAISEFTLCLKQGKDCRAQVLADFASTGPSEEDAARLKAVIDVFWTSVGAEVERLVQSADLQQKRSLEYLGRLPNLSKPAIGGWVEILKEVAGSLVLPDGTAIEKKKGVLEVLLSSPSGPQLTFQL
jgi:hypothetical protein